MANEFRVKNGLITPKIISEESDGRVVLTQTATADNEPIILAFETAETDIAADDVLGKITFAAPDEDTGTDALLVAGAIAVVSEGDFASDNNASKMVFQTGASETATTKLTISSAGVITTTGNLNVGAGLDVVGATTLDGAVTLGNATGDDITNTGRWVGDFVPKTNSSIDLGTSSLQFAQAHIDTGHIDDITSTGTSALTTLNVSGVTSLNGNVTLGNATGDDITVTGYLASDIIPKTDLAYDLGSATLGFNTLHIGATGIINFEAGDISLTHSTNTLTMSGGTFVSAVKTVSPIYNNTLESGSAGAGFRVTNTATMSLEEKGYLNKTADLNSNWTGLAIENNNVITSCVVTDTGTVAAEELIPLVYINLNDDDHVMFHSVSAHCAIQCKTTSNEATVFVAHETVRATYKAAQNRVEFKTIDSNWYNALTTRTAPPGEFCAQRWVSGDDIYLVISWCQYKAIPSGKTTTVTAMVEGLQQLVVAGG